MGKEDLAKRTPDPSLAQVRQAVNEYCILPMGSREVHLNGPYESGFGKSALLYGPPGVGKTLLVHAVANECGMLLFDLSPDTINNLYPSAGPKKLMVQKVFKVAKHYAPSIIYIDDIEKVVNSDKKKAKIMRQGFEKPFWPDLMKKQLQACMKDLVKEHSEIIKAYESGDKEAIEEADKINNQVMLICESKRPYDLNAKDTKWMFANPGAGTGGKKDFRFCEKLLYVPQPDYSSQLMIVEHMLTKACRQYLPSVPKQLVQTLAHIAQWYTPKYIEKAVKMTLKERRLQRLERKSLSVDEFVPALASFDPVFKEDDEDNSRIQNFKIWTAMAMEILNPPEISEEDAAAAAAAKGGKKK